MERSVKAICVEVIGAVIVWNLVLFLLAYIGPKVGEVLEASAEVLSELHGDGGPSRHGVFPLPTRLALAASRGFYVAVPAGLVFALALRRLCGASAPYVVPAVGAAVAVLVVAGLYLPIFTIMG